MVGTTIQNVKKILHFSEERYRLEFVQGMKHATENSKPLNASSQAHLDTESRNMDFAFTQWPILFKWIFYAEENFFGLCEYSVLLVN